MKQMLVALIVLVVVVVAGPFVIGVCTSVGSGIIEATRSGNVLRWYNDEKNPAHIQPYVEEPDQQCPDPNEFCVVKHWWDQDIVSRWLYPLLNPLYEAGLEAGVPMWNNAMSNSLIRLAFPVILGAFIAALAKKIVDGLLD